MNLYKFNLEPYYRRLQLVQEHGLLLACRSREDYHMQLYYLPDFFAEVWYESEHNQVVTVLGFKSINRLESYLNLINLPDILV